MSGIIDGKPKPPESPSVATPLGGGLKGKVTGVTRMSSRAGFIAIAGLAAIVFAIFYGITSNTAHSNSNRVAAAEPTPQAISTDVPIIDDIPGANASAPPIVSRTSGSGSRNNATRQPGGLSPQQQQAAQAVQAEQQQSAPNQAPPQLQNAPQVQSAGGSGGGGSFSGTANAQMQNAAAMAQAMIPQQPTAAQIRAQQAAEAAIVRQSQQNQVAEVERNARQSSILIGGATTNSAPMSAATPAGSETQAASPYVVQEGSVIPATLLTGLNSDLPGTVIAMVNHDVYDSQTGKYRLIPAGSKLVGRFESQVVQGQSRVTVGWNRILYPNGSSVDISGAEGADAAGYAGFTGKVDKHTNILNTILSSIIGIGTAIVSQPRVVIAGPVGGAVVMQPSVGQQAEQQAGQQAQQQLIQANNAASGQKPTIEVRPGYIFNIFVNHDLVLAAPYQN